MKWLKSRRESWILATSLAFLLVNLVNIAYSMCKDGCYYHPAWNDTMMDYEANGNVCIDNASSLPDKSEGKFVCKGAENFKVSYVTDPSRLCSKMMRKAQNITGSGTAGTPVDMTLPDKCLAPGS